MEKIQVKEKFEQITAYWDPKRIGTLNGQDVRIAKFKGSFTPHRHVQEDELFYVVEGEISIKTSEKTFHLEAGEMLIVPAGTEHQPMAEEEALVMMFEPSSTLNTGNVENEMTQKDIGEV